MGGLGKGQEGPCKEGRNARLRKRKVVVRLSTYGARSK